MDREKAADLLDNLIGMVEDNHGADYDTALKMEIEALSTSGDGPEPVDDTISRQAAIDAMSCINDSICGQQAIDALCELPSAQPEQQWIPCKTRLPEESGTYLVSGKWGSGKVDVGDCVYLKEDGYFDTAWNFDVLAWMQLPESYKEEDNERA